MLPYQSTVHEFLRIPAQLVVDDVLRPEVVESLFQDDFDDAVLSRQSDGVEDGAAGY